MQRARAARRLARLRRRRRWLPQAPRSGGRRRPRRGVGPRAVLRRGGIVRPRRACSAPCLRGRLAHPRLRHGSLRRCEGALRHSPHARQQQRRAQRERGAPVSPRAGRAAQPAQVVDQRCGRGEQRQRVVVGTRRRRKCRGAGACGAVHWACHQRRRAVARRWRSLQQDLRLLARRAPAALHPPSLRDAAHRIRLQHPRHVDVHARCCVRQQRFLCVRSMSFLP